MNNKLGFTIKAILLLSMGVGCMTNQKSSSVLPSPPRADKKPHLLEKHGIQRVDNYFWLKERSNPQVLDYLKKENEYTENSLNDSNELKEKIYLELKSRVVENESSAPYTKGHYQYSSRYEEGKQYLIFERENLSSQRKELLLDLNQEAKGYEFYDHHDPNLSHDQNLMAYTFDNIGRRFYTIAIKDLKANSLLPARIENTTGNLVWSKDNNYFFYTKQHPETLRAYQVYRFDIKKNQSTLVYEEKDETFSVYLYENLAKNYVFFITASTLTSEVHFLKSSTPLSSFQVFSKRKNGHEYMVYDGGDRFFIKSNNKALNFKILETSLDHFEEKNWKEVVAHDPDILIENLIPFKNFIVVFEKNNGLDKIKILNRSNSAYKYLQFKDSTYTVDSGAQGDYDKNVFRYVFESMRQPEQTFDYHMDTEKTELVKERKIPGFDPEKYLSERVWITARDGQKIPVSLLNKREHSSKQPLLIYAYGSYGSSMTPWFSQTIFSLVDRGFVFCIAHVRGGSELGRKWYDDGRTHHKLNTFFDFIDVTEFFSKQKDIDAKNIFAMGGSAGGLLMGAIINMRPELYKGLVAQVPFVDVLTTMLDESIPLTTGEYDEWGNPNNKKDFEYMAQYSPYDNIQSKKYPHVLVTTGLHDSQVQYWEPAKWVAKLRDFNQSNSLILLKTDLDSGHGGASGRYEQLKEKALEYSFIVSTLKKEIK